MMNNFVELSCPNCSSELNYDAEKSKLKCLHCAAVFEIEHSDEIIHEISFDTDPLQAVDNSPEVLSYKCSKCGKENTSSSNIVFFECSNCGNNVINTQAYKQKVIHPSSILPFAISKNNAADIFKQWIGKGFWNESSLKDLSLIENLKGHYIPFWTFDVSTANEWSGQAGYYYYETENYTDQQGRRQTRSITKTRWEYHSGSLNHFFDDILICGNKDIPLQKINGIYPYQLEQLVPLNEKYIAGWSAENYSKNITESFEAAKSYINDAVYRLCSGELGGDTQTGLLVNTEMSNRTYKHIVLPVWVCEYLYKGTKYSFIINGQTGKIDGKKPISATKVSMAIIVVLLVALLIFYLSQQ